MSMLDSFFSKGFKAAKCKTLLKLTIPRIKLLRNRREVQLKQMRREIAKLLETGQEATARIRVEHIIREEKMMAAHEIVELFCELVAARLPIIEAQRECPLDLKEAISSICFAAPRCTDLPELLQVQTLFAGKYGKEFVAAATELMPECGVNRQLLELMSVRAPPSDIKLKLLREIAEEHELDWDPSACESEFFKPHEDLLKGPSQFLNSSNVETPDEKTTSLPTPESASHENSESDSDFDIIDFPEVPTKPLQSDKGTISVPEMLPFPASALSELDDEKEQTSSAGNGNLSQTEPVRKEDSSLKISTIPVEDKQFVPFICPPSQSTVSPVKEQHSHSNNIAKTENNINLDLEDVLAAAQAAAESAEIAAVAARSAASIAQLRISELVKKNNDEVGGSTIENPFHMEKPCSDSPLTSPSMNNTSRNRVPSYDVNGDAESSPHRNYVINYGSNHHQPQRLPSMDEETVFSYPNLFTSKGSDLSSH